MGSSAFEILVAPVVGATFAGLLAGATVLALIHVFKALIEHGHHERPAGRASRDRAARSGDLARFTTTSIVSSGFALRLHQGRPGR